MEQDNQPTSNELSLARQVLSYSLGILTGVLVSVGGFWIQSSWQNARKVDQLRTAVHVQLNRSIGLSKEFLRMADAGEMNSWSLVKGWADQHSLAELTYARTNYDYYIQIPESETIDSIIQNFQMLDSTAHGLLRMYENIYIQSYPELGYPHNSAQAVLDVWCKQQGDSFVKELRRTDRIVRAFANNMYHRLGKDKRAFMPKWIPPVDRDTLLDEVRKEGELRKTKTVQPHP